MIQTQTETTKRITLHKYQAKAYHSQKRFILITAGTGGGKTHFAPVWLAKEINKYPTEDFLVVSPTYKMLNRVLMPKIESLWKGTRLQGSYAESKGLYRLPTGGNIWCGSADRPETLEGVHVRAVVMDEPSLMKRYAWIIIQARIGQRLGRALLTGTPTRGRNWLYHEFYQLWKRGDIDYDCIQFPSIANPYYPKEEYERAKRTLDSRTFKIRYEGLFEKMEGLVYIDFDDSNIIDYEPKNVIETRYGIDWGFNNPAVVDVFQKNKDGIWHQVDEWYENGKLIEKQIDIVREFFNKYGRGYCYCDPSEPAYIQTFLNAGIPAIGADNSIRPGISEVQTLTKTKRLLVHRRCKNTIEEYESYVYPENDKDVPVKEYDHSMDATRYAMRGEKFMPQEESKEIYDLEDVGMEVEAVNLGDY